MTRTPTDELESTEIRPFEQPTPERIGNYRILQKVGEGGMGVVFEAEQEAPVRRRVALKLIKWGMDTSQVVARFEAERQALAMMNHPNVARVLDAGATLEGRPYFVMEFVRGVPITEHCDRQRLTTRQRLELFLDVCEGVQHAHQKGIIHRDIKPSNILVEIRDGAAVPKIIDFGVAKATDKRLTEKTLFTGLGQIVGTPEYMSPEQAERTQQDIDTRTDVYSLGIVLYELMVGALPFDTRALREAGYDEIRRRIREDDPPKPSTRISTLGEDRSVKCAQCRRTDPRSLARTLRGDLDWIVVKAMEKDRTRRYPAAMALAADLRRHLNHHPVEAGPPAVSYRVRKFVRRHRAGVMATTIATVALVAGSALAVTGMIEARRQRDVAVREATRAESISGFLMHILAAPDPYLGSGRDVRLLDAIDRAKDDIEPKLGVDRKVEAEVKTLVGDVYRKLGEYIVAEELLESALRLRLEQFPSRNLDVAETRYLLASARHDLGRLDEAEEDYLEALEVFRSIHGQAHPDVAESLNTLARLRRDQGDLERSEELFREALRMRQGLLSSDHPDVAESMHDLAQLLRLRGRPDESESLYRQSLEINTRVYGERHPSVAYSVNGLAALLSEREKFDEAETMFRQSLEIELEELGPDHEQVATTWMWIAHVQQAKKEFVEAETSLRAALEIYRRELGDDHGLIASVYHSLGVGRREQGDLVGAMESFEKGLAIRQRILGPDHWLTAATAGSMGACLSRLARYREAETNLVYAFDVTLDRFGEDHRSTIWTAGQLVELFEKTGEAAKAAPYRRFIADAVVQQRTE